MAVTSSTPPPLDVAAIHSTRVGSWPFTERATCFVCFGFHFSFFFLVCLCSVCVCWFSRIVSSLFFTAPNSVSTQWLSASTEWFLVGVCWCSFLSHRAFLSFHSVLEILTDFSIFFCNGSLSGNSANSIYAPGVLPLFFFSLVFHPVHLRTGFFFEIENEFSRIFVCNFWFPASRNTFLLRSARSSSESWIHLRIFDFPTNFHRIFDLFFILVHSDELQSRTECVCVCVCVFRCWCWLVPFTAPPRSAGTFFFFIFFFCSIEIYILFFIFPFRFDFSSKVKKKELEFVFACPRLFETRNERPERGDHLFFLSDFLIIFFRVVSSSCCFFFSRMFLVLFQRPFGFLLGFTGFLWVFFCFFFWCFTIRKENKRSASEWSRWPRLFTFPRHLRRNDIDYRVLPSFYLCVCSVLVVFFFILFLVGLFFWAVSLLDRF